MHLATACKEGKEKKIKKKITLFKFYKYSYRVQSVISFWLDELATLHSNAKDFFGVIMFTPLSFCGTQVKRVA